MGIQLFYRAENIVRTGEIAHYWCPSVCLSVQMSKT